MKLRRRGAAGAAYGHGTSWNIVTTKKQARHKWRAVPLTDYEANLLRELADQAPNVGTWRGKLLAQIAERFANA